MEGLGPGEGEFLGQRFHYALPAQPATAQNHWTRVLKRDSHGRMGRISGDEVATRPQIYAFCARARHLLDKG